MFVYLTNKLIDLDPSAFESVPLFIDVVSSYSDYQIMFLSTEFHSYQFFL